MEELLAMPGVKVINSSEDNRHGRLLVQFRLADGRSIGNFLIAEGFAKIWNAEFVADWCE